jgi:hypothetical protein
MLSGFWSNCGLLFDLAPELNALVIFIEHRYYGKSLPFGANSWQTQNIGYVRCWFALPHTLEPLDTHSLQRDGMEAWQAYCEDR